MKVLTKKQKKLRAGRSRQLICKMRREIAGVALTGLPQKFRRMVDQTLNYKLAIMNFEKEIKHGPDLSGNAKESNERCRALKRQKDQCGGGPGTCKYAQNQCAYEGGGNKASNSQCGLCRISAKKTVFVGYEILDNNGLIFKQFKNESI